jgi:GNAT superfamily N-acetyltransferase
VQFFYVDLLMSEPVLHVSMSDLEKKRFGIRVARALMDTDTCDAILNYCQKKCVRLLIARCQVAEMGLVHKLENQSFLLMDTLVYYSRDLVRKPPPDPQDYRVVRSVEPGEEEYVRKIAVESFSGYIGHYHSDERLDKNLCDEIYPDWAYRSCTSKDVADDVLVVDEANTLIGFLTLRMNNPTEVEGVLNGVEPAAQKRGVYTSLLNHGILWAIRQGAEKMLISTQISNFPPQKIWTRLGFEFSHAYYTFHKWFDD